MNIYTASEMKWLEAYVMEHESVTSLDLMECAAAALYEEVRSLWNVETPIKVFAGAHNNGGDALALSRLLALAGYNVEVFLLNTSGNVSEECATLRDRLLQNCPKVVFHEITKKLDLPNLTARDLVIDGIFGIGLHGKVTSGFALLIKYINNSPATVLSIDMPSGLSVEDNTENFQGQIVQADYTLSFQGVKPAFLQPDCQKYIGKCKILDIGLENNPVPMAETTYELDNEENMRTLLRPRDPFGNKGSFGHGLLIAGTYGMAGAAVIAARSAMKSGMGKLTVHTPSVNNSILQTSVPQAIMHNDEDNYAFTSTEDLSAYDAVAIGPGLGRLRQTETALMEQIGNTLCPLVLDADALNILADHKTWIQQIPHGSVITPHPKEFERLFGPAANDFAMLSEARIQAQNLRIYIVLKNHYTAICCPNGRVYFNTTGNSGMATAGTGDALTGILLSLMAQGYDAEDACRLGCYLHGLAGDLAAQELTEEGMTVLDLIQKLPYAFKELKKSQDKYC